MVNYKYEIYGIWIYANFSNWIVMECTGNAGDAGEQGIIISYFILVQEHDCLSGRVSIAT